MKSKKGVNITGIRPELLYGLICAEKAYNDLGYSLVVTSINDGRHSRTSLHYAGCAADLRIWGMGAGGDALRVRDNIKEALPDDFDIILEKDHIHMEWQPRYRG